MTPEQQQSYDRCLDPLAALKRVMDNVRYAKAEELITAFSEICDDVVYRETVWSEEHGITFVSFFCKIGEETPSFFSVEKDYDGETLKNVLHKTIGFYTDIGKVLLSSIPWKPCFPHFKEAGWIMPYDKVHTKHEKILMEAASKQVKEMTNGTE